MINLNSNSNLSPATNTTATASPKAVANSLPATLPESLEVAMELQRTYKRLYKADPNLVAISEDNVHVRPAGLVSIIKYLRPDLNLNLKTNPNLTINLDTESDLIFTINPDSDPDFTLKCALRPGENYWVYKLILEYKDVEFIALLTEEEYNEFWNNWK